ncbi:LysR family transcriptional regulator [Companilactobacillus futsaii]|uniref:LysR family transcriptional regulator n=2 Tax=Companilactobacillus futsaii TaxID=938155 RepID=A0A5B7T3N0_9LACO|nr:LysR family transcriptional regulator [Companilactobacillus futsaii]KRK92685.1 LysR family transcriptional regulator [Companilactobacillus futsaii JCM 17355]QCX25170.1 LysR family transcriptional regulator [Companilactobacillus futsaii]
MDLHKLQIFVDLSKTLNYTDTANNLFTTQGNISKQILSLEKELDVPLFKRAHRKIELTQQGEIVLPYAKEILAKYSEMTIKLADFQDSKNLTIEMHTIPTMPSYVSFNLITKFLQQHPEVHMQLKEEESYNLVNSLKSGLCEIIFARMFDFDGSDLEYIEMEDDDFVAVLPKNHPFANEEILDLKKLKKERFLILGPSTNLYDPVIKLCQMAGFKPDISYQGTRVDLIMQMVQNNMGISLMMKKTAQNFDNKAFSLVPLTTNIANKLCFVRVKGQHSSANNMFWKYVKTHMKDIGG